LWIFYFKTLMLVNPALKAMTIFYETSGHISRFSALFFAQFKSFYLLSMSGHIIVQLLIFITSSITAHINANLVID
ncbi:MAG: hypothetical protein MHMPM18_003778, partial [Marteilia pararefringens]